MVIDRLAWRLHGDLLEYLATTYPGLTPAQYEAAYRLLLLPEVDEEQAQAVERLLAGCAQADADKEVIGD